MELADLGRILFGSSMALHQLVSGALPGLALCLIIIAIISIFEKGTLYIKLHILFIRLFLIQFAIAVISGVSIDTGLSSNWEGADKALLLLSNHPFGRSAILGFFIMSVVLGSHLFLREKINSGFRLASSIVLFLSSFLLSGWSIVVNTWMQNPEGLNLVLNNGIVESASITDYASLMFNDLVVYRFIHFYQAQILQGLLFSLMLLAYLRYQYKTESHKAFRFFTLFIIIILLTQPLIGHLQFRGLTEIQPNKTASIEGYYSSMDNYEIYILGITDPEKKETYGIAMPEIISNKMKSSIDGLAPLNEEDQMLWPPVSTVFYSFRLMIASWAILLALCLALTFFNKGRISARSIFQLLLMGYLLSIIAAMAGWMVSEFGRQPWIINNLVLTGNAASVVYDNASYWTRIGSSFLIHIGLIYLWIGLQRSEIKKIYKTDYN